jgi:hypothetical protein
VDKQKEVTAGDSAAEVVSGQADESQPDFRTSTRPAISFFFYFF